MRNQATSAGHRSSLAIGIDGCRGGWVVASRDGVDTPVLLDVRPTLDFLAALAPARACIDIPIGLTRSGRACEALARRALPGGASRVFSSPCREALACATFREANALSKRLTGKGLSQQSFNIMPKIREADELLARAPHLRGVLREIHPEVLFARRAGRALPSKKTAEGVSERIAILSEHLGLDDAHLRAEARRLRSAGAQLDDVLDAAMALVVALAPDASIRSLPEVQELDERGLAMEIIDSVPAPRAQRSV